MHVATLICSNCKIIVQVTSFSINGAIPGSTTSYRITLSSGSSILQSLITDVDDTCEYTVKIPSSNCSISGNVDVTIVAANRLGFGPPSEPTTIGMCCYILFQLYFNVNEFIHWLEAYSRGGGVQVNQW